LSIRKELCKSQNISNAKATFFKYLIFFFPPEKAEISEAGRDFFESKTVAMANISAIIASQDLSYHSVSMKCYNWIAL